MDIDNSGNLNFAEFLMLMVKTEGVEGVRIAFDSYDTGEFLPCSNILLFRATFAISNVYVISDTVDYHYKIV